MQAKLIALGVLLGTFSIAPSASAFPSYGTNVDRTCTANGWIPARPFNPNGANPSNPALVNCGICHTRASNPNSQLNTAGRTYKSSGRSDVSPFCSPPPPMNHAPAFAAVGPQQASVGQPFQLSVRATDADGDAIALSISNSPAGATFSDAGNGMGTFTWTPSLAQTGNRTVTFHAADDATPMAIGTLDVTISVGAATNRPPLLVAIGDQQVDPGMTLSLTFTASDPDGDALTFSVAPLPSGATLTGPAFAWTPSAGQVGSYPITVTVTDSGSPAASDSEALVITVGRVNRPPLLSPIGNRTVDLGQTLRVALAASDPDGDAITLSCLGLPSGAVFTPMGSGAGEIVWTPSVATSSSATCSAVDGGVPPGTAQETFMLTARDPAPPPGAPSLGEVAWDDRGGVLRVEGAVPESAMPSSGPRLRADVFAVLADGTLVNLGRRVVRGDGTFRGTLHPFIAPCEVAASVNGAMGVPMRVSEAPASCDARPLVRVRARTRCDGFQLRVRGRRAPPNGLVTGSDAATGDPLFSVAANARGAFSTRVPTDAFVDALRVEVSAGGVTWSVADDVDVRSRCGN